jgi:adenylosuccinate synthase
MIINEYVDAVIGLQYGDEGKGKVTAALINHNDYELCARYNGGPNAGHSIHKENEAKYELHQLPSSIPYKKTGWIGPGTILDLPKLRKEVDEFKTVEGFNPLEYLRISTRVPLITDTHKKLDANYHYETQGSTNSGIAPGYAEFYNRTADLTNSLNILKKNNLLKDFYILKTLLLEGAQGFYLNPHNGNYPYVTSSSSHPASAAASFGFSPKKFRHIIGVAKCYETRSGYDPTFMNQFYSDQFLTEKIPFSEDDHLNFQRIQIHGKEKGVTTGRKRKVRYLCVERLINSIQATGTTIVVINKWDILEELSILNYIIKDKIYKAKTSIDMFTFLRDLIRSCCPQVAHVIYSASPKSDIDWGLYLKLNQ